jgi:serine kinase of HPr protein (carbohydrate metabolism regulator)
VASNLHATAVVLGDRGVLITSGSGSGKTALALALMDRFRAAGRFASLLADDQVLLSVESGRLVASAPPAIHGLVEVFGLGPRKADFEPRAIVDLLIRLTRDAPRLAEAAEETIHGAVIPRIDLAERSSQAGVQVVASWFGLPPFA